MVSKLIKWGKYLLVNVSKNGRNSERHRIYVLIWFDLICVENEEEEESWETIDKMAIFKMAHIIDRILLNFITNSSIFKLKKSFIDWIIYRFWGRNELILCQNEGHNRKKFRNKWKKSREMIIWRIIKKEKVVREIMRLKLTIVKLTWIKANRMERNRKGQQGSASNSEEKNFINIKCRRSRSRSQFPATEVIC